MPTGRTANLRAVPFTYRRDTEDRDRGLRDGLGARLVVARGQALQHSQQQPFVHLPRRLIGLQRHLGAADHIAHPRHLHRQFLIAQVHRPGLRPPAAQRLVQPLALIPRPGQGLHAPLQLLRDRLQPQGDQQLDDLDASLQIVDRRGGLAIRGSDGHDPF